MANSSGLKERPSRTSLRGVTILYHGSMPSSGQLELDSTRFADSLGGIENLQGDQVPLLVVVENHARFVLIALRNVCIGLENNAQCVGFHVIGGLHGSALQYFSILLVR